MSSAHLDKMLTIYVAGPFRAKTSWEIAENVRRAERVGLGIIKLGAMALIPHANTALFTGYQSTNFWLTGTLELLSRCDAMVVLPNHGYSQGTLGEIEFAERHNIEVAFIKDIDEFFIGVDDAAEEVKEWVHDWSM